MNEVFRKGSRDIKHLKLGFLGVEVKTGTPVNVIDWWQALGRCKMRKTGYTGEKAKQRSDLGWLLTLAWTQEKQQGMDYTTGLCLHWMMKTINLHSIVVSHCPLFLRVEHNHYSKFATLGVPCSEKGRRFKRWEVNAKNSWRLVTPIYNGDLGKIPAITSFSKYQQIFHLSSNAMSS